MKNLCLSFILFFSVVLISSCNKYENGANFSLLSKKARIVNSWRLQEASLDGQVLQLNTNTSNNTYSFNKDFSYQITGEASQTQPAEQNGTWSFHNNKESVIITVSGITDTLRISKLKNKDLWLKKESQNGTLIYKYVPR